MLGHARGVRSLLNEQFCLIGLLDQLVQIGDSPFYLDCDVFQELLPLSSHRIFAVQSLVNAAVDLRKLLRGEKPVLGDQTGAGHKVLLGTFIVVPVIVPLPQRGVILHPLPGDELHPVPCLMACQHYIVELCQQPIVALQPAGLDLWSPLHEFLIFGSIHVFLLLGDCPIKQKRPMLDYSQTLAFLYL